MGPTCVNLGGVVQQALFAFSVVLSSIWECVMLDLLLTMWWLKTLKWVQSQPSPLAFCGGRMKSSELAWYVRTAIEAHDDSWVQGALFLESNYRTNVGSAWRITHNPMIPQIQYIKFCENSSDMYFFKGSKHPCQLKPISSRLLHIYWKETPITKPLWIFTRFKVLGTWGFFFFDHERSWSFLAT